MQCFIYKSLRRPDTYVFLAQQDDFAPLPAALRERLGELHRVMTLELHPQRRLARGEAGSVMRALREHGFHLQLPPTETRLDHALD
jgi:uncharacterized protein YcgL (UPF0745 family)